MTLYLCSHAETFIKGEIPIQVSQKCEVKNNSKRREVEFPSTLRGGRSECT